MKQPKRCLEVGMFVGYGAMAIAEGLPEGGKVVSLEIDPFLKNWVKSVTEGLPQAEKHEIVVGPALESLAKLPHDRPFDLVFVDANKSEYRRYVEVLLERGLLAEGAMIIADNVMYNGYPMLPSTYDTQPHRREFGDCIREFNAWVRDHDAFEQMILPIRDGVSFIRFKGKASLKTAEDRSSFRQRNWKTREERDRQKGLRQD
jgi:caffeoyl-CoA O-methyltransferase